MSVLLASFMLAYGPGQLQTDQVFPAGPTVVALVHGGGFKTSAHDARALQPEAKKLQKAGFTAVIVNYLGCSLECETSDVVSGAQAVHATTLIGGSSGGTLVAYAAMQIPVVTISLSGDLNPGAALTYWKGKTGGVAATHVGNLTHAGVTANTVPPVLTGTAYVYASVNEDPIVVTNAQSFGGNVTLVPGTGHAWDYWPTILSQVESEIR